MPLSPRCNELIKGMELHEALWHLQRANSWDNRATAEELIEGYSRILQLAQNTGGCVKQILAETDQQISAMSPLETMIEKRGNLIREGKCADNQDLQEVTRKIAEYVRLTRLQRQAEILQEGGWVQIWDIAASIQSLPDEILTDRARILAILPQQDIAA